MGLLYNFRPLVINPELAILIGLNEAIVLQQIKYWLEETDSGQSHKGRQWVYNTYENWQKQFPFWSLDTVKRTFRSLEKSGCILGEKLEKANCNHIKFYAINYENLLLIEEGKLPSSAKAKCPVPEGGILPPSEGAECIDLTETTYIDHTDTTADIKDLPAPALPVQGDKKSSGESALQAACKKTWLAYGQAYLARYGALPLRNQTVNSQIKKFVQRVGMDAAPDIAEFYLSINTAFYVQKIHPVGNMLADAEALHTQWATGTTMTNTRARQIDKTQSNYSAAEEAVAMLRKQREQGGAAC